MLGLTLHLSGGGGVLNVLLKKPSLFFYLILINKFLLKTNQI